MKKYIGILIIAIFVFSSLAYSFIQGSRFSGANMQVSLPKKSIINYKLSKEQTELALRKGYTIVLLEYKPGFNEVKNYLEAFAEKEKKQMILEEIVGNQTFLEVKSLKGSSSLSNPTVNQTEDLICQYLLEPPMECVLRQV